MLFERSSYKFGTVLCLRVCLFVCVRACVCVCLSLCVSARLLNCAHSCVRVNVFACVMHTSTWVCGFSRCGLKLFSFLSSVQP